MAIRADDDSESSDRVTALLAETEFPQCVITVSTWIAVFIVRYI
ncbi:hypothetical protein PQQ72_03310 [Paraburkholderia strydomiana]